VLYATARGVLLLRLGLLQHELLLVLLVAVPEFGPIMQERSRRQLSRPPCVSLPLEAHVAALTEAGFRAAGEVWRVHEAAAVAAVR
jgi:hypothetical protein